MTAAGGHAVSAGPLISAVTARIRDDASFRRRLTDDPDTALAECALDVIPCPQPLPAPARLPPITDHLLFRSGRSGPPAPAGSSLPLEVRLVRYALKPMGLVHGSLEELDAVAAHCARIGLATVLSPHEFHPRPDREAGGYVNEVDDVRLAPADPVPDEDPGTWRGLLRSPEPARLALGWLCLAAGWDVLLGVLLGYPRCCAAAFPAAWREAVAKHRGEIGDVLLRHHPAGAPITGIDPVANVFARHLGHHLSQHFPCGFDCPATAALARTLWHGLAVFEPETARELRAALSAPTFRHRSGVTIAFPGAGLDDRGRLTWSILRSSRPDAEITRRIAASSGWEPDDEGWLLVPAAVEV